MNNNYTAVRNMLVGHRKLTLKNYVGADVNPPGERKYCDVCGSLMGAKSWNYRKWGNEHKWEAYLILCEECHAIASIRQ